jgi:hypothetical protein
LSGISKRFSFFNTSVLSQPFTSAI